MTTSEAEPGHASSRRHWVQLARSYLFNPWVLLFLGVLVLIVGALFNWGWLVAVGIAPIVVALAPCAIMCGLGLCAMKMLGGSNK